MMNVWLKTATLLGAATFGAWFTVRMLAARANRPARLAPALETWEGEGGNVVPHPSEDERRQAP